jgi:hypothetical protein
MPICFDGQSENWRLGESCRRRNHGSLLPILPATLGQLQTPARLVPVEGVESSLFSI